MKKTIFFMLAGLLVANLFIACTADAETIINFQWTANTDEVTTEYEILMDTGENVIVTVPGRESESTSYTLLDDEREHVFSILAKNSTGDFSRQGAMKSWRPEEEDTPGAPKQYLLTLELIN